MLKAAKVTFNDFVQVWVGGMSQYHYSISICGRPGHKKDGIGFIHSGYEVMWQGKIICPEAVLLFLTVSLCDMCWCVSLRGSVPSDLVNFTKLTLQSPLW